MRPRPSHGQGLPPRTSAYFKPTAPGVVNRIQCDIGTFANCRAVNADGTVGAALAPGFDFTGYALIPGVLHAYKASAADLARLVRGGQGRAGH